MPLKKNFFPAQVGRIFSQLKRLSKASFNLALDTGFATLSFPLAASFCFEEGFGLYPFDLLIKQTLGFSLLAMAAFFWTQSYRNSWRSFCVSDLLRLNQAIVLTMLLFLPFGFLLHGGEHFSASIWLVQGGILALLLNGWRLLFRAIERHLDLQKILKKGISSTGRGNIRLLLIGTDDQAVSFFKTLQMDPQAPYRVVGALDVHTEALSPATYEIPVLGTLKQWDSIWDKLRYQGQTPDWIVFSGASLHYMQLKEFLHKIERLPLELVRLPGFKGSRTSRGVDMLRPLTVEDVLIGPQQSASEINGRLSDWIKGKRLLITGAGGTLGRELLDQILGFSPAHVTLWDQNELLLSRAQEHLDLAQPHLSYSCVLADIRRKDQVPKILAQENPDLVFHMAALKNHTLAKTYPSELVSVNVLGTCYLADACLAQGVEGMVLISNDTALDASDQVATTKRLAEMYMQALDDLALEKKVSTRFISIQMGRLLASPGSIIPLFTRQISQGGPVTVTHPQAKRPLLSPRIALQRFLNAAELGLRQTAFRSSVLTLNMGDSVSILEIAETLIRLFGFVPGQDIPITFTGLRPDEILDKGNLLKTHSSLEATSDPMVFTSKPSFPDYAVLVSMLKGLEDAYRKGNEIHVLKWVRKLVPEANVKAA